MFKEAVLFYKECVLNANVLGQFPKVSKTSRIFSKVYQKPARSSLKTLGDNGKILKSFHKTIEDFRKSFKTCKSIL